MTFLLLAIGLALLAIFAAKGGMKAISRIAGIAAAVCFIAWLASGPGFAFLDWMDNPSVPVPDNIPIPGGG